MSSKGGWKQFTRPRMSRDTADAAGRPGKREEGEKESAAAAEESRRFFLPFALCFLSSFLPSSITPFYSILPHAKKARAANELRTAQ